MNGELPTNEELLNTLNRARVAFLRFRQMASQRVDGMTGGTMTPEDLELVDSLSDMTEKVDESLVETREVFGILSGAVVAYRNQTEPEADSPRLKPKIGESKTDSLPPPPIVKVRRDNPTERALAEERRVEEIAKLNTFFENDERARRAIIDIFARSGKNDGRLSRFSVVGKIFRRAGLGSEVESSTLKFIYTKLEVMEADLLIRDEQPPVEGKKRGRVFYFLKSQG